MRAYTYERVLIPKEDFKITPSCIILKELKEIGRVEVYTQPLFYRLGATIISKEEVPYNIEEDKHTLYKYSRIGYNITDKSMTLNNIYNTIASMSTKYTKYPYHVSLYVFANAIRDTINNLDRERSYYKEVEIIKQVVNLLKDKNYIKETVEYVLPLLEDPEFVYSEAIPVTTILSLKARSIKDTSSSYLITRFSHVFVDELGEDDYLLISLHTLATDTSYPSLVAYRLYREKRLAYVFSTNSFIIYDSYFKSITYMRLLKKLFEEMNIPSLSDYPKYLSYHSITTQFLNDYISYSIANSYIMFTKYFNTQYFESVLDSVRKDNLKNFAYLEKVSMKLSQEYEEPVNLTPSIRLPRGFLNIPKESIVIHKLYLGRAFDQLFGDGYLFLLPNNILKREFRKSSYKEEYYTVFTGKTPEGNYLPKFCRRVIYPIYHMVNMLLTCSLYSDQDVISPMLISTLLENILKLFKAKRRTVIKEVGFDVVDDKLEILCKELELAYSSYYGNPPYRYYVYVIDPFSMLSRKLFTGRLDEVEKMTIRRKSSIFKSSSLAQRIQEYSISTTAKDLFSVLQDIIYYNGIKLGDLNQGKVEYYPLPHTESIIVVTPHPIETWSSYEMTDTIKEIIRSCIDKIIEI